MKYNTLGNSNLTVSNVILGTWALGGWMWGGTDRNEPVRAVQASIDHGVTTIDTAPIYGFGMSEELVGKAIKGRRDGLIIATKCGMRWDLDKGDFFFDSETPDGDKVAVYKYAGKKSVLEEWDRSLPRLGIDVIDLYQCHWPDSTTPKEETMEAFLELQDKGKIRAFGVSNFDVPMLEDCMTVATPASLQPEYNLLSRDIEDEILPFCKTHNIAIICYSSMYRGLLTGKFTPDHTFSTGDTRANDPWYHGDRLEAVNKTLRETVQPIADAHNVNLAQIAVAWCLAQEGVTAALVGARNQAQADANAVAADVQLDPPEVRRITDAFDTLLGRFAD
ncbi:MAG: aldo/keto reductase [Candidatus Pacebacteria bacterium]|nr:aldo/keto reductase [Candidatus Paceibacterota bacterium]